MWHRPHCVASGFSLCPGAISFEKKKSAGYVARLGLLQIILGNEDIFQTIGMWEVVTYQATLLAISLLLIIPQMRLCS